MSSRGHPSPIPGSTVHHFPVIIQSIPRYDCRHFLGGGSWGEGYHLFVEGRQADSRGSLTTLAGCLETVKHPVTASKDAEHEKHHLLCRGVFQWKEGRFDGGGTKEEQTSYSDTVRTWKFGFSCMNACKSAIPVLTMVSVHDKHQRALAK